MSEILNPRVLEILEEGRRAFLAQAEAARLGIEGGETLAGGLALEAARARLTEAGVDPDTCDADQLAAALEAVGELPDDLVTVPPDAPAELEPVDGQDVARQAERLVAVRGVELNQDSYQAALAAAGWSR